MAASNQRGIGQGRGPGIVFRQDEADVAVPVLGLGERETADEVVGRVDEATFGVSRNIISALETNAHHRGTPGNPRLDTVYRLALALQVPPGALLPDVDSLVGYEASPARPDGAADMAWPERYEVYFSTPRITET